MYYKPITVLNAKNGKSENLFLSFFVVFHSLSHIVYTETPPGSQKYEIGHTMIKSEWAKFDPRGKYDKINSKTRSPITVSTLLISETIYLHMYLQQTRCTSRTLLYYWFNTHILIIPLPILYIHMGTTEKTKLLQ